MRHPRLLSGVLLATLAVAALGLALWLRRQPRDATTAITAATPAAPAPAGVQPYPARLPPPPPALATALAAGGLLVAWTAHGGGRLEPCGCSAGMHGGLVRLASLLGRVPRERRLTLACGGWNAGAADYQRERSRYYLDGLAASGCDAVALGSAEAALGAERLAPLVAHARSLGLPLLGANLLDREGRDVVQRLLPVERCGRRYALTAVLAGAAGDGLALTDATEAVLSVQRQTRDPLIVLADLDEEGLAQLARAVPGLYAVIGGAVAQPSLEPLTVGTCRVVHAANDGKTLGWWLPEAGACAFELVTEAIADHPALRELVHRYQERIALMDLQIDERIAGLTTLGAPATGAAYSGSQACQPCHRQEAATHAASGHATALSSLERRNYHRDPDCLRCHVTGLGLRDGWSRRAPAAGLGAVGCESCHGRGSLHIAECQEKRPSSGSLAPVTPATCRRCHDAENSPRFDYPTYWRKIAHGRT